MVVALHGNFDTIAIRVHFGAKGCIRVQFVLVFKLYLAMVCQSSDRSLIGVHDDHMCIIPHQKRFDLYLFQRDDSAILFPGI